MSLLDRMLGRKPKPEDVPMGGRVGKAKRTLINRGRDIDSMVDGMVKVNRKPKSLRNKY